MSKSRKVLHVVIVGMPGKLSRRVTERCGDLVRLSFIPSSRSDTRYPPSADFVILTRWVAHRSSVAAKGIPGVFCDGGQTQICQVILDQVEGPLGQNFRNN
jgi:hypothetical protein